MNIRNWVSPSNLILVWFSFFALATFPGWMSGDSYTYWVEATGEFLISDWHSPLLSFFWSKLNPWEFGPAVPYILQLVLTVFGLNRIIKAMESKFTAASWVAAVLVSSTPLIWITPWIWTDSYITALLLSSLGFFINYQRSKSKFWQRVYYLGLIVCLTFSAMGRPYLVFPLLFFSYLMQRLSKKSDLKRLITFLFLIAFIFAIVFQQANLNYWHSGSQATTMLFDLAGVECKSRKIESRTPREGLVPREFILNTDVSDFCESYSPATFSTLFWTADKSRSYFRMPSSSEEMRNVTGLWVKNFIAEPAPILLKKSIFLKELILLEIDSESFPLNEVELTESGTIGLSSGYLNNPYKKMYLSRGGLLLEILSWPSRMVKEHLGFLTSYFGHLFLVGLFYLVYRRGHVSLSGKNLMYSQIPSLLWVVEFGFLAPALGFRYLFPGFILSIAGLVLTFVYQERDTQVTR